MYAQSVKLANFGHFWGALSWSSSVLWLSTDVPTEWQSSTFLFYMHRRIGVGWEIYSVGSNKKGEKRGQMCSLLVKKEGFFLLLLPPLFSAWLAIQCNSLFFPPIDWPPPRGGGERKDGTRKKSWRQEGKEESWIDRAERGFELPYFATFFNKKEKEFLLFPHCKNCIFLPLSAPKKKCRHTQRKSFPEKHISKWEGGEKKVVNGLRKISPSFGWAHWSISRL